MFVSVFETLSLLLNIKPTIMDTSIEFAHKLLSCWTFEFGCKYEKCFALVTP
jgi:hypothetical protein